MPSATAARRARTGSPPLDLDRRVGRRAADRFHDDPVANRHPGSRERGVERALERAITDDVTESRQVVLGRGEPHKTKAAGLGHVDRSNGVTALGIAASAPHAASRSRIRRAPCDSASERSPRSVAPAARASSTTTSRSARSDGERESRSNRPRADDRDIVQHRRRGPLTRGWGQRRQAASTSAIDLRRRGSQVIRCRSPSPARRPRSAPRCPRNGPGRCRRVGCTCPARR